MIESLPDVSQGTASSFPFPVEIERSNGEILVTSHPRYEDKWEEMVKKVKERGYRVRSMQRIKEGPPPVTRYMGVQLNAVLEPIENF